jgi:hypothetical protein
MRKKLLEAGAGRIATGSEAWEPPLALVADAKPEQVAERLRAEAAKLRKGRKAEAEARMIRALARMGHADDDDRYRLASLRLRESKLDPRARSADGAIRHLGILSDRGYDVVGALKKDRGVSLEALYYVGFCFVEDEVAGGEELLEIVVEKGGRKKIAKAAKNKLKLVGWE